MRLHRNWKRIIKRAHSVKLLGGAFSFIGAEAALPYIREALPGMPPGLFAVLAAVCVGGAFVARITTQAAFGTEGE